VMLKDMRRDVRDEARVALEANSKAPPFCEKIQTLVEEGLLSGMGCWLLNHRWSRTLS